MKNIIIFILTIGWLSLHAQSPSYRTYSASIEIAASKNGIDKSWKNKDIIVNLNYKTGKLDITLKNSDFKNTASNDKIVNEESVEEKIYFLKGYLPINEILNQKPATQSYKIELQLTNEEFDFSKEINFDMSVMRTSQQAQSYRVFTLSTVLYNDEVDLPAFKEYDNEVEIVIIFNAYWNQ